LSNCKRAGQSASIREPFVRSSGAILPFLVVNERRIFAFDVLAYSAIFILVVMGLGVIASMMGIFNFAHGEFVLLGAYTVYLFQERGLPVWAGMLAAPFAVAVVGLLLERTVIRRFYAAPVAAMLGSTRSACHCERACAVCLQVSSTR